MRKKSFWGNFLYSRILLSVILAGALLLPAQRITATETEIVRVAAWNRGGRFEQNENGELAGYDVDLIEKIAAKCRFQVEYVWVSGPAEALEELDKGNVDLVTTMVKTAEREEHYLYGANATGKTYSGMIAKADRDDLIYEDIDKMSTCEIGYEGNSGRAASSISYLKNVYGVTDPIPYDSIEKMRDALEKGDIDIMVTGANNVQADEKIVDLFAPREVYYLTDQKNISLMNKIDDAFASITMNQPEYIQNLQKQYFPMYINLEFTKKELDYIQARGTITVGVPIDRQPISYYNKETGKYEGIVIEILEQLRQETGLTFSYVGLDKGMTIQEALSDDRYDIVAPSADQSALGEAVPAYTTDQILSISASMASLEGKNTSNEKIIRVGELRELAGFYSLPETRYEEIDERIYNTQEEMLDALKRGEIDAIINNTYVWNYLMQSPKYEDLSLEPTMLGNYVYCIGGNAERTDGVLMDILNKGIRNIDENNIDTIVARYTMSEIYQYTFSDYMLKHRTHILIIFACIFLSVFFAMVRNNYYEHIKAKNEELLMANKTKSEFLSRMSHEIRTPLNAILGMAELGKDSVDSQEETLLTFDKINSSGRYLLGILNDVLDMSRIESGRIELHTKYTNAKDFLNVIVTMVKPLAEQRGVELITDFDRFPSVMVKTDTLRAEQIYANLLNNAIKFSESGNKVEWIINSEQIDDAHLKVICIIRDYGCGMSKRFQEKMFEPFAQEHNKYSDTQPGTGLGLAIVKNLVGHMGGTIEVKSEPDKGTTFTLHFIREIQQCEEAEEKEVLSDVQIVNSKHPVMDSKPGSADSKLEGRHILLVEDHPLNIEISRKILQRWNALVEVAVNGQIAVDMVRDSSLFYYDAILMDIRMPVMDGLEATKTIRLLPREDVKEIPIIAMTANAFDEDVRSAKVAGMDGFLAKPVEIKKMYEVLLEAIGKREK